MIISDQYRFIFIHIPKTGGTSIKQALNEQGIAMSKKSRLQRFLSVMRLNKNYKHYRFRTHGDLRSVEKVMPADLFNAYIKFSVVRNPLDRLVSEYEYFRRGSEFHQNVLKRKRHKWAKNISTFEDFVHAKAQRKDARQYDFLKNIKGELGTDIVLRQELLNQDFQQLAERLGINGQLKPVNVTKQRKDMTAYYDAKLYAFVARHWAEDFNSFNYPLP